MPCHHSLLVLLAVVCVGLATSFAICTKSMTMQASLEVLSHGYIKCQVIRKSGSLPGMTFRVAAVEIRDA
ncbi:hypothetical protein CIRG_10171 [Coccidioides immitis RMSCC 2394]|uniref:Secreted protein n=1 Tax=Coccidioides immitis RMSCC 2394 TaxID=404692 RepID=A0A0J6Y6Q4_COCIT|nr:hypothetical protein CIRG_10171 [Coccidioides immitis RMSCC 2394]